MLFNEKLYKLRKESGLSQEALAEKICTSRQAVSKWENNQGFPETEKLLLIGNIFNVSIDYLLKDANEDSVVDDNGYYASKEMVEEYFINREIAYRILNIGVLLLILGMGSYYKFKYEEFSLVIMVALLVLGGIVLVSGILKIDDKLNVLEHEVLIMDANYHTVLKNKYRGKIKKLYIATTIAGVIFFISVAPICREIEPFTKDFKNGIPFIFEVMYIVLSITVPIAIYSSSMLEVYNTVISNEKHTNSLSFKLSVKIKKAVNEWLK